MINTFNHYFPMHDEDAHILLGLLQVKYNWINDTLIDPGVVLGLDGHFGRITAECQRWPWGSLEAEQQSALLKRLEEAFWQLAALQCQQEEINL